MVPKKYNYRVTSNKEGSHLQPQTFTILLGGALDAAKQHARELPECTTRIEERTAAGEWKLWEEGNWGGNWEY